MLGPDRPPEYVARLLTARAFDLAIPIPRLPASLQRTVNLMNMAGPNGIPSSEVADPDALALVPVSKAARVPHHLPSLPRAEHGGVRLWPHPGPGPDTFIQTPQVATSASFDSGPGAVARAAGDWLRAGCLSGQPAPCSASSASSTDDDCDYEEPIPLHEQQAQQQRQLEAMAHRLAAFAAAPDRAALAAGAAAGPSWPASLGGGIELGMGLEDEDGGVDDSGEWGEGAEEGDDEQL